MKKIVSIFLFLIIVAGGIGFGITAANGLKAEQEVLPASSTKIVNKQPTKVAVAEVAKPGIPQTIKIPSINVDAAIESVGLDAQKRMDVPKEADNGGWYQLGVRPGEKGNAVIAGHLDKEDSSPAVFYDVTKLKAGDTILITDDKGKDYTFQVVRKVEYPYNDFPIPEVFGASDKSMLNLISCKGTWDEVAKNYSHRTVIYSQLVK